MRRAWSGGLISFGGTPLPELGLEDEEGRWIATCLGWMNWKKGTFALCRPVQCDGGHWHGVMMGPVKSLACL
jgi:hypothetical protein